MSVGIDNDSVPTRSCSFNYEMSSRPRKYYVSFERLGAKSRHFPIRRREHEIQETFSPKKTWEKNDTETDRNTIKLD